MKRQLLLITGIYLISLIVIIFITSIGTYNIDGIYKVNINRIQQKFTDDLEKDIQIIKELTKEDLNLIKNIEIISYQNSTYEQINNFFTFNNEIIVFKPIEGTDYMVKYYIENTSPNNNLQIIFLLLFTSVTYICFIIHILRLHRNVTKPLKKISSITKQLARGYLGEVNLQYKNEYFKDFIWGLDMLREQLAYERDKNYKLEKERKTLVAGLSHDLKTPLSSVKNYTIALKENIYEKEEDINNALEIILDKVEVMEKLTKELLDTSLKEVNRIEVKPKEVYMLEIHNRLNKIIHQKTDLLHIDYFEAKLEENLMVIVDLERLKEVFDNIIENALKYGDLKSIKTSYSMEENYQLIEIYNTGDSIPQNELKYIFNSYYRGSNVCDKSGFGLGLYISKQIMKNMQGDIYAQNKEDGVSFVIVIKQAG